MPLSGAQHLRARDHEAAHPRSALFIKDQAAKVARDRGFRKWCRFPEFEVRHETVVLAVAEELHDRRIRVDGEVRRDARAASKPLNELLFRDEPETHSSCHELLRLMIYSFISLGSV